MTRPGLAESGCRRLFWVVLLVAGVGIATTGCTSTATDDPMPIITVYASPT